MKTIPLNKGRFAVVDDCDFDGLSQFDWWAVCQRGIYYAIGREPGSRKMRRMHRLILKADPGQLVDHRDGNGLNNRRDNLRLCNYSQNGANRKLNKNQRFKGVSRIRKSGRWQAAIRVGGVKKFLGNFGRPELAAKAYDDAAQETFGRFAKLNSAS